MGIEDDINRKNKEEADQMRNQGILEVEHKQHQECVNARDNELCAISRDYKFSHISEIKELENSEVDQIMSKLEQYLESETNTIKGKKDEFKEKESKIQTEMDSLRSQEAALNNDIKNKTKDIADKKIKNRELKTALIRIDSDLSNDNLDTLQDDIKNIKMKMKEEESKIDKEKLNNDIVDKKKQKKELEKELNELNNV